MNEMKNPPEKQTVNPEEQLNRKLTIKESRFVEEFCIDFNATRAAKIAGYSAKHAAEIGYQNYRKLHINKAIKARLENLSMSAEEATKRLSDWGRGSIEPFTRTDEQQGLVVDLSSPAAAANLHLIKRIKQSKKVLFNQEGPEGTEYYTEIELHDAKDAVVQIAKIHALFVTNVNHSGNIKAKLEGMTDAQLDEMVNLVLSKSSSK